MSVYQRPKQQLPSVWSLPILVPPSNPNLVCPATAPSTRALQVFFTTLKQLSPRYHWEGVSKIHYTPRGFSFQSFLISFFFKVLNLSKSTQWTCLTSVSSASPEYKTSPSIIQWIFKICLPSQHACFPRLMIGTCIFYHIVRPHLEIHMYLTRSKVWFALSRSRAWCASSWRNLDKPEAWSMG